jgi:hypothetical protein
MALGLTQGTPSRRWPSIVPRLKQTKMMRRNWALSPLDGESLLPQQQCKSLTPRKDSFPLFLTPSRPSPMDGAGRGIIRRLHRSTAFSASNAARAFPLVLTPLNMSALPIYFLEWVGFAIASWSLLGVTFAFCTFCNLAPRGLDHHKWYKNEFKKKYPKSRKAVIPFIW